jgi:type II secretion system protein N
VRDAEIAGELELKDGHAAGLKVSGFTLPELQFATISAKFAVKGEHIDIEELRADGPQLKVNGGGQITLRGTVPDSVLNLKVTLQPGPESDDNIKSLLTLVPRPKNARPDAPLAITGTVRQPRFR